MSYLVLPLVSAGNVPQLTTDLLLHSLSDEFEFVETLDSTFAHPFVGPLDYVKGDRAPKLYLNNATKKYSSVLELFYSKSRDTYVVQQRAPIIEGYLNNFIKHVVASVISRYSIENVVILDSYCMLDENVPIKSAASVHTLMNNRFSMASIDVASVSDIPRAFEASLTLDSGDSSLETSKILSFTPESQQDLICTSQQIFKFVYHLTNLQSLPLKKIIYFNMFVHEGDNGPDAYNFCEIISTTLPIFSKIAKLTAPVSWEGVYGTQLTDSAFNESLYM